MPQRDPFRVLVSAVLSTRTQDSTTAQAADRLFRATPDAQALSSLKPTQIERLIYPVGFYHTKARLLPGLGRRIAELGRVPDTMDELLRLPGVGRKVANIVLANAFKRDVIPVDTHVHRISNRLGLVRTRTPEQTEQALMRVLPQRVWRRWNYLLVVLGQTVCRPVGPKCGECPILRWCEQVGVNRKVRTVKSEVRSSNVGVRRCLNRPARARRG
jgi:endonuclease-3